MKKRMFGKLALLSLVVVLTGCGATAATVPTIDATKDPMGAYAAEMKFQYDTISAGYKKGSLDDKDIAAYLASWDRVAKLFPAASEIDQKMTDQQRSAYVEGNFKYPWISGGTFLKDGSLEEQTGFYGAAIGKNNGKLLADWTNASLALSLPISKADPGSAQVLALFMALFNGVFVDLDKVVKPDQKKELGNQIILKMVACWPSLGYTEKKMMTALQGAAGFGMMANTPVLKNWLGY